MVVVEMGGVTVVVIEVGGDGGGARCMVEGGDGGDSGGVWSRVVMVVMAMTEVDGCGWSSLSLEWWWWLRWEVVMVVAKGGDVLTAGITAVHGG